MTNTPLTKAEREELRRLNDVASPGPWNWRINRAHKSVELESPKEGGWTVMGFERWGMSSACPSFRRIVNGHSILVRADEMARNLHGRDHHSEWCQDIDQPDALLLAAARNALPSLLADLDAAEAERDELRQIAEGCCNATDGGCSPGVSIEFLRGVPKEVGRIRDQRDRAGAERDRAESELDAERKMRLEAEAASDRMMAELATLLADLDAAEAKRDSFKDALFQMQNAALELRAKLDAAEAALLCKGCGGTVGDHLAPDQGGCPGSFEIDGVQMVPLAGRDNAVAQRDRAGAERDRAESELATMRADRDAALIHLPVCCGSLADAADTLRQERDELAAELDATKAKLSAAESAHSELFLSGQVAELRAKIAALVASYDHVFGDFEYSTMSVDARILFDAIAAARGD